MAPYTTSRRVEFIDVDMNGIVHFSRFLVFVESAEHEMLRARGGDVHMAVDGELLTWPRVETSCQFHAPARLGDRLEIALVVERVKRSSVRYRFEIERDGDRVADGHMTIVCCVQREGSLTPVPVPATLAEALVVRGPE